MGRRNAESHTLPNKINMVGRFQPNKSGGHYYIAIYVRHHGECTFQRAFNVRIYSTDSIYNQIIEIKEKYEIDLVTIGTTKAVFTNEGIVALLDRFR